MATHFTILAWRIPMDRGAWWATVHRVAKSRTRLKQLSMHGACTCYQGRVEQLQQRRRPTKSKIFTIGLFRKKSRSLEGFKLALFPSLHPPAQLGDMVISSTP